MDYTKETKNAGKKAHVKDYKKRVKRNRLKRKVFFTLFCCAVLGCVLAFAPFFNISKICVYDNKHVTEKQIISASKIGYGNNIFRTSLSSAEKGIMRLPYVESLRIKRKFPNRINIAITECEIAGYIPYKNSYIYIDKNCKMLEMKNEPPKLNVPMIDNLDLKSFTAGGIAPSKVPSKVAYVSDLLKILIKNQNLDKVTLIKIPDINNLSFVINNKLEVLVGENNYLEYKVSFLTFKSYTSIGSAAHGKLDVTSGDKAVYKELY